MVVYAIRNNGSISPTEFLIFVTFISGASFGGDAEEKEKSNSGVDGVRVNADEKIDSIQLEYTYLLTSQLESQRR